MAVKWSKKICIDHIVQLKSPLENIQGGQGALSPLTEKLRELGNKFRMPKG